MHPLLSIAALVVAVTALALGLLVTVGPLHPAQRTEPLITASPEADARLLELQRDLAGLRGEIADLRRALAASTTAPAVIDTTQVQALIRSELRSQGQGRGGSTWGDQDPAALGKTLASDIRLPEAKATQVAEAMQASRSAIRDLFRSSQDRSAVMAAVAEEQQRLETRVAAILDADQAAAFQAWQAKHEPQRGFPSRRGRGEAPAPAGTTRAALDTRSF